MKQFAFIAFPFLVPYVVKKKMKCIFYFSKARIAFLQGERKGQENLKKDLVRRIKMLEYALKQERYVYLISLYE
jgi:hypothetical protein